MCLFVRLNPSQESLSSAGTPHKRDSLNYSTWLEDSISSTSNTSCGSSPGERGGGRSSQTLLLLYINWDDSRI